MTMREKIDELADHMGCDIILLDGLDDALVGTTNINGDQVVAVYDYDLCISVLQASCESTYEEAVEYFYFNVENVGLTGGPIFLNRPHA